MLWVESFSETVQSLLLETPKVAPCWPLEIIVSSALVLISDWDTLVNHFIQSMGLWYLWTGAQGSTRGRRVSSHWTSLVLASTGTDTCSISEIGWGAVTSGWTTLCQSSLWILSPWKRPAEVVQYTSNDASWALRWNVLKTRPSGGKPRSRRD